MTEGPAATPPRALSGLVVAAIADDAAALLAAGLLADHGARVVLLEEPRAGSRLRAVGRRLDWNSSLYFESEARGLESVALDLADPEGVQVARRLLAGCDVLIEDLGKGGLERLDLAPGSLLAGNARLAVVRISPYGQHGPLSGVPGDDRTAQAFSGAAYATGFADGPPRPHRFPLAQSWTGLMAASGALLAALQAARSGRGQVVDLALYETVFRFQEEMIVQMDQLSTMKGRMGNEYAEAAPISCYPTDDGGWVFCSAANNASFVPLCRAMDRPEWPADPRFSSPAARIANRAELNRLITDWSLTYSTKPLVAVLRAAGAAVAEIRSMEEIVDDPQVRERRSLGVLVLSEGALRVVVPNAVPRLERTPGWISCPAPRLGQHTGAVLAELAAATEPRPARPEELRAPRSASSAGEERGAAQLPLTGAGRGAAQLPLTGIRVLDLGRFIAAPVAAELLAEFGAEVIRIELPGGAAGTHLRAPVKGGVSLSNAMYQRGKRAMTLDTRRPEGRAVLLELVGRSDVIIENFRPGTLEGWGLGSDELRTIGEGLILVRLSGFGQTGPDALLPAFDPVALAAGGGTALLGGADGTVPLRPGLLMGDYSSAIMAFFGTLLALYRRLSDGRGQVVDLALYESVLRMLGDAPARYSVEGETGGHADDPWTGAPQWLVGEAADGRHVLVSDWPPTPRLSSLDGWNGEVGDPAAAMRRWISARSAADAEQTLRRAGIVCSVILNAADLIRHPHLLARGNVVSHAHHKVGQLRQQGVVPALSWTPGRVAAEAPYGTHTAEILSDLLGYPEQRIRELAAGGAI